MVLNILPFAPAFMIRLHVCKYFGDARIPAYFVTPAAHNSPAKEETTLMRPHTRRADTEGSNLATVKSNK